MLHEHLSVVHLSGTLQHLPVPYPRLVREVVRTHDGGVERREIQTGHNAEVTSLHWLEHRRALVAIFARL